MHCIDFFPCNPLEGLEMEECPLLKTPPKEIRAKGFSTTFAYLRRLVSGSMPCKRTKLMLVGLGGAGKTRFVVFLLHGLEMLEKKLFLYHCCKLCLRNKA